MRNVLRLMFFCKLSLGQELPPPSVFSVCASSPTAISANSVWYENYTEANAAGKCFNNVSASSTQCYSYTTPASGNVGLQIIINDENDDADCTCDDYSGIRCNGFVGSCSSVSSSPALNCLTQYNSDCTSTHATTGWEIGASCTPAQAYSTTYVVCFVIPAGCSTLDICPIPTTGSEACSGVPIELLSFSVSCRNNAVIVNWTTSSEVNNDYFNVERSMDGVVYEVAGALKGAGNSNTNRDYEFTDDAPPFFNNEYVYYRLKQTDFDGEFEYFQPLGISSCLNEVYIEPTISDGSVFIRSDKEKPGSILIVTDAVGIKIKSEPLSANWTDFELDLRGISNGVYFIKFNLGNRTVVRKILLQQ